jgi:hypothetical protein
MPERPPNSRAIPRVYPTPEAEAARKGRFCPPPADAIPTDDKVHLRWVRNNPRRLSDMRRKYGYAVATDADVKEGHGGYAGKDGIENGDLILMKTDYEYIEKLEVQRREDLANMDKKQARADRAMGIEEKPNHSVRRGRGKTFSIPIDLNK